MYWSNGQNLKIGWFGFSQTWRKFSLGGFRKGPIQFGQLSKSQDFDFYSHTRIILTPSYQETILLFPLLAANTRLIGKGETAADIKRSLYLSLLEGNSLMDVSFFLKGFCKSYRITEQIKPQAIDFFWLYCKDKTIVKIVFSKVNSRYAMIFSHHQS